MSLYRSAVIAWGACMPKQLSELTDRSDETVAMALSAVIGDVCSATWTIDAKIAWDLLQGREPPV